LNLEADYEESSDEDEQVTMATETNHKKSNEKLNGNDYDMIFLAYENTISSSD
jgi:hypothetical protein